MHWEHHSGKWRREHALSQWWWWRQWATTMQRGTSVKSNYLKIYLIYNSLSKHTLICCLTNWSADDIQQYRATHSYVEYGGDWVCSNFGFVCLVRLDCCFFSFCSTQSTSIRTFVGINVWKESHRMRRRNLSKSWFMVSFIEFGELLR